MSEERRASDGLRAIDGLLAHQLELPALDGRALANLAVAMATELTGARRGTLLLDSGGGLEPVLSLGPELTAAPLDATSFDQPLVDRARRGGRAVAEGGALASPIVIQEAVRGALYLERERSFAGDDLELAESVTSRIAHLLRSAELVSELSRRTRNLELLESLSRCLTAGSLAARDLARTLDAALHATASQEGILGLLGAAGGLDELLARGADDRALRSEARELARRLADRDLAAAVEADDPPTTLLVPLVTEAPLSPDETATSELAGFLLVRRSSGPAYDETDRTFFRALAHLVSGALERRDYYRRAAEDPVTGTGSRLALQLGLSQLQAAADRTGVSFSLIIVDVDNFKEINDRHGHVEGDRVLKRLAETLRHRLRDQDFLARYGGDEFVALLPSTDAAGAAELAEELRRRVRLESPAPEGFELSVSMGVVTYPDHAAELAELIDLGDRALYASKAAGRDCVTVAGSR